MTCDTAPVGTSGGEFPMNSKLTKLAAAGALSFCTAVPALAASVTQPGETVGLNAGAPLPQGWYAINTVDWGCRTQTRSTRVRVSPFRSSLGQRRGRFWARDYSFWGRGPRWKPACNATQASVCQAPTLTGCTTRRCSANWPGTSAMDGALATYEAVDRAAVAALDRPGSEERVFARRQGKGHHLGGWLLWIASAPGL